MTAQLTARAFDRLASAFRLATRKAYDRMFWDFVGFLVVAGLSLPQVARTILFTFMEYLHRNHIKVLTINNYISAVMSSFIRFGLTLVPLEDHSIALFVKALIINRPISASHRCVL